MPGNVYREWLFDCRRGGGNGGNGLSLTIFTSDVASETFTYTRLLNEGGHGGRGGVPNPRNLGYGEDGSNGQKGVFVVISASDLSEFIAE